ncbi:hypothetical protein H261_15310 [Paramagnetospirillum caucaseum]|uniref:Uncharacterized protein n=1 Tax=Paramagnetospirillum caucaseum TaxID=1244869 RepID=M2Y7L4_9PROT|nr:hypothetical protein H261_15310 [Paramagnetospirillum caucaseum]
MRAAGRNAEVAAALAGWDGVLAAEGKPAAGSVVLRYDPAGIAPSEIEARIRALFAEAEAEAEEAAADVAAPSGDGLSLWSLNRPAKIGMLASLTGTLLALAVGKKLHAAFGAAHVAFLLVHLANHRKKILQ